MTKQRTKRVAERILLEGSRRYKGTGKRFHRVKERPSPFATKGEDNIVVYEPQKGVKTGPVVLRMVKNVGRGRYTFIAPDEVERPYDILDGRVFLRDITTGYVENGKPAVGSPLIYLGPRSGYNA